MLEILVLEYLEVYSQFKSSTSKETYKRPNQIKLWCLESDLIRLLSKLSTCLWQFICVKNSTWNWLLFFLAVLFMKTRLWEIPPKTGSGDFCRGPDGCGSWSNYVLLWCPKCQWSAMCLNNSFRNSSETTLLKPRIDHSNIQHWVGEKKNHANRAWFQA